MTVGIEAAERADATLAVLVERVFARAGLARPSEAAQVVDATLASLAEVLAPDDEARLRSALPPGVMPASTPGRPRKDDSVEAFFDRVADRTGIPPAQAREAAQEVLAAVAAVAEPGELDLLRRHLGSAWERFFQRRAPASAPAELVSGLDRHLTTLASGRPGSRHPLSEARPLAGQTHSVATSADPHVDTRLSSARGTTQERLGETLATARGPTGETLAGPRRG